MTKLFKAQKLWSLLGDVPIDEQDCIETKFLHFEAGTNRLEIWHWFEDEFEISVVKDLMGLGLSKLSRWKMSVEERIYFWDRICEWKKWRNGSDIRRADQIEKKVESFIRNLVEAERTRLTLAYYLEDEDNE